MCKNVCAITVNQDIMEYLFTVKNIGRDWELQEHRRLPRDGKGGGERIDN